MSTIDLMQYPLPLSYTVDASSTYPTLKFVEWLNELEDPLYWQIAGDDNAHLIAMAASLFPGGTPLLVWCPEGGIGFYKQVAGGGYTDDSTSWKWTSFTGGRLYGMDAKPALLLTHRPLDNTDMIAEATFASEGQTTLIATAMKDYDNNEITHLVYAARIRPASIEIVAKAESQDIPIHLLELPEPSFNTAPATITPLSNTLLTTIQQGQIAAINLALATDTVERVAKFSDGAIATEAKAWRADTGAFVGAATPDPESGLYSLPAPPDAQVLVTVTRQGYRPLTHGPL